LKPLNLASRPFHNERLPSLLAIVLVLVVLGVTVLHAMVGARVGPSSLSKAEGEALALSSSLDQLQREGAELADVKPSKEDRLVWAQIRDLVDRRLFRWTLLLSRLQEVLPEDVRLLSVDPAFRNGQVAVRLSATALARGSPSLLGMIGRLEEEPAFREVTPASLSDTPDGDVLVVDMQYVPPTPAPPKAKPQPEGES
jgi:Tfp pilus assembly protein PilN